MSRSITTATGLLATWLASFVLVMLHRLMATLAFHSHLFGSLIKGRPALLVEDGHVDHTELRRGHILRWDLEQAVREAGKEPDISRVRLAYLERDGSISVVPRHGEARVLEVTVENNVQVVKIALE